MLASETSRRTPRTFLPPDGSQRRDVVDFARRLSISGSGGHDTAVLISPDGESVRIPGEIFDALVTVAAALANGDGVTVMPSRARLTTQEAADFLGVSRPTFVKILEAGGLEFELVGRHRRVMLSALVEYQERIQRDRLRALADLTASSQEHDLYGADLPPFERASPSEA
ncbi:excisionase family DNA-binding protein [Rathayibacter sp. VKM Ac-2803]|uniref:excisionase family DNA-binding protein n=1 Tax=unclassified Rathayibacter TaxID=2609250 RepID=UPI0013582330|nr:MULTISPECIES: excisionase family DNA-binding protein [unclassified Rathayibacter]MWV51111.1 excisionase family DNA-binding protein [Rathayibacter sp. VKM Ac-2803]MWV57596.1 excisionase family DNA-binding protein [Rathayibacter sp. VKM Ac-2754]